MCSSSFTTPQYYSLESHAPNLASSCTERIYGFIHNKNFANIVTSKTRGHQNCGPEELVQCAKPLSVLTDSGLTFVSSKTELDRMCPDLRNAIRCIHSYTRHCMTLSERNHFKKLFHGTNQMVHELCGNETYQQEYLKHAPCMKKVEEQNEICLKRYTTAMKEIESRTAEKEPTEEPDLISYQKRKREAADEGIKSVCCSFQQYVECSTHTMKRTCGEEAAQFSREFLGKMSSSLIQLHCREYGKRECGLLSSAFSVQSSILFSLLSGLLVLLI